MNFFQIILIISLVLLLLTKLSDVWTTVRHIGRHGESNPLARALFAKVGFAGGLVVDGSLGRDCRNGLHFRMVVTCVDPSDHRHCRDSGRMGAVGRGAIQCDQKIQPDHATRSAGLWSVGVECCQLAKKKPMNIGVSHFAPTRWRQVGAAFAGN